MRTDSASEVGRGGEGHAGWPSPLRLQPRYDPGATLAIGGTSPQGMIYGDRVSDSEKTQVLVLDCTFLICKMGELLT